MILFNKIVKKEYGGEGGGRGKGGERGEVGGRGRKEELIVLECF